MRERRLRFVFPAVLLFGALLLACCFLPVTALAADMQDVHPDDTAAAEIPIQESSDVEFVYMDAQNLSSGDAQYVVFSFVNSVESPVLYVRDQATEEVQYLEAVKMAENAALFYLPTSQEGSFALHAISYGTEGARVMAFFEGDAEAQFSVVEEGSVRRSAESSVEVDTFVLDENGDIVEESSLSDSVAQAFEATGGAAISVNALSDARVDISDGFVIVLDPGHGGYDPGACANGMRESDLTLKIAQACKAELEKYANVKVYMTREDDSYVGLEERALLARDVEADFFMSFHINAGGGQGAEVWIPAASSWYSSFHELGDEVGGEILDKLAALGLDNRGTKFDYYTDNGGRYYPDGSTADSLSVIRNCRLHGVPAILIEHGFIDAYPDAEILASDVSLVELGIADANAIVDHFGLYISAPLYGFSDVYSETPHTQEIGWLASAGVTTGYVDGTFGPYGEVVRCDMAAFLYRLAGSPAFEPTAEDMARFSDVTADTPHAKEIWWLASVGITTGYADGTFGPSGEVSRCDMAAFLHRFAESCYGLESEAWDPSEEDMARFVDVDASTFHAEDIWWLASSGVTTGYADGTFDPYGTIARCDMAAFLYRMTNFPAYSPTSSDKESFTDVDDSTYHAQEIWWLASASVTTGYADGTFDPYGTIARCDMAAFLYRLAGSPAYEPTAEDRVRFTDVDDSTYHAREIWWLASVGITTGYADGTFEPYGEVARCDMAAFLHRFYILEYEGGIQWNPSDMSSLRFTDVDASTFHAEDVWWLASSGIASGYIDGTFGPYETIARCDMAAFLYRLDLRLNRKEHMVVSSMPIMGVSDATVDEMVAYYNSTGNVYPVDVYASKGASTIEEFAAIVLEEARAEGVKAEVVFCQAMKETGWLRFGGSVRADQCNFAGLGAVDGTAAGATFPDVRIGIRAQVQHLKAYASTEPLVNHCVDPRFNLVQRGCAPYLADLDGRWAVPGNGYGRSIEQMLERLLDF